MRSYVEKCAEFKNQTLKKSASTQKSYAHRIPPGYEISQNSAKTGVPLQVHTLNYVISVVKCKFWQQTIYNDQYKIYYRIIWNATAVFCYSLASCLVDWASFYVKTTYYLVHRHVNVLKMYAVLYICNVLLLKSYHVLSLRSVILLQRQFVLSNCSVIVLKALLSCLRVVLIHQKYHISCQLAVLLCVKDMLSCLFVILSSQNCILFCSFAILSY